MNIRAAQKLHNGDEISFKNSLGETEIKPIIGIKTSTANLVVVNVMSSYDGFIELGHREFH